MRQPSTLCANLSYSIQQRVNELPLRRNCRPSRITREIFQMLSSRTYAGLFGSSTRRCRCDNACSMLCCYILTIFVDSSSETKPTDICIYCCLDECNSRCALLLVCSNSRGSTWVPGVLLGTCCQSYHLSGRNTKSRASTANMNGIIHYQDNKSFSKGY